LEETVEIVATAMVPEIVDAAIQEIAVADPHLATTATDATLVVVAADPVRGVLRSSVKADASSATRRATLSVIALSSVVDVLWAVVAVTTSVVEKDVPTTGDTLVQEADPLPVTTTVTTVVVDKTRTGAVHLLIPREDSSPARLPDNKRTATPAMQALAIE